MAHPALKRLERALKAAVLRVAIRAFGRGRLEPPDWRARPYRLLYLRFDRIGDMLLSTGLLRAITTTHPTIHLDVLASPSNACVLEGNPHVRRVLICDRRRKGDVLRTIRELRRERYDAVIDGAVVVPSVTSMLLMLATRARYRIGLGGLRHEAIYSLPVRPAPSGSLVVVQAAQVLEAFGLRPEAADLGYELFLREDELSRAETTWGRGPGRPRVLVNVSAFTADRRWPPDRFAEVVRHLRRQAPSARIVVVGDPGDWPVVEAVAAAGGAEAVRATPVREAFALVARADALLTPDTSLAHAAAATGTPVAVLFRGDWLVHAPMGARLVPVVSPGSTLEALPVAPVLTAADRLLELASATTDRPGPAAVPSAPPGSPARLPGAPPAG